MHLCCKHARDPLLFLINWCLLLQGNFAIPAARSKTASPSPKQQQEEDDDQVCMQPQCTLTTQLSTPQQSLNAGPHPSHCLQLQVCEREDSESYAKRTITEIETCLGFSFHGAGEEEEAETITNAELEVGFSNIQLAVFAKSAYSVQPHRRWRTFPFFRRTVAV